MGENLYQTADPQTSQLDSSSWFAAHTFLTRIQLPVNTTKPRGTMYQKQESAFKCTTIMIFYFWIENVYPNRDRGPQFHFRPVAGCWPGVNSGFSVLQRPYSRFTTLNIGLEVMWFVANHSTSECFCVIMSFFCLTEFRYLIKGAIKRHFRRFTAVIHNFLPTLLSQLRDLSFQSKQKITLREVSFLLNVRCHTIFPWRLTPELFGGSVERQKHAFQGTENLMDWW